MQVVLHQVQRIVIGKFFAKKLIHNQEQAPNKEEVVFSFLLWSLELEFQGSFQKLNGLGGWKMEHFATIGHITIKSVIRNLALFQRFAMINAPRDFANRVLHISLKESLQPKFTRLIGKFPTERHGLVAREKSGAALGTNAKIQVTELDFSYIGITKRANTHIS